MIRYNLSQSAVSFGRTLIALAATMVLSVSAYAQTTTLTTAILPDNSKQVWAHELVAQPTFNDPTNGILYGAHYPLKLREGIGYYATPRADDNFDVQKQCGLTGVQLLTYGSYRDSNGNYTSLESAVSAAAAQGFTVAPCLEVDSVDDAVNIIKGYAAIATNYPAGAAKITIDGVSKYLIFIYGSRYQGTTLWSQMRSRVDNPSSPDYVPCYFVGDVVTAIEHYNGFQPNNTAFGASVNQMLPLFQADWTFDVGVDRDWNNMIGAFNSNSNLFTGGVMPAYNRKTPNGGFRESEGTALFRRQWNLSLQSGFQWNNVVSWNDVQEQHDIWPSSTWNWTRGDMNAFFSAKLRGGANWRNLLPTTIKNDPQLYVTTPQRINVGQSRVLEVMALNTGTTGVTVKIQLLDGNNAAYGSEISASVAAGNDGSATITFSPTTTEINGKRWVRARARLFDSSGTQIKEVISAPVLIFAQNEQTGDVQYSRVEYYSIPARKALASNPTITLSGDPIATSTATATVGAPSGITVRFAEVLQNNYEVKNFFSSTNRTTAIPLVNGGQQIMDSTVVNTVASGFYVARVISSNEEVGYSDPVYVNPTTFRIKNRWKNVYIYDGGALAKYGTNPSATDLNYQWTRQTVDSTFSRFVNRSTGDVLNIENNGANIECTAGNPSWWSSQWASTSMGSGFERFTNRNVTNQTMHIEDQTGNVQAGNVPGYFDSSHWSLEPVN